MPKQDLFNDKNLSQVASEIWSELQSMRQSFDEARWWGCSEVGGMIFHNTNIRIDRILTTAGLTRQQFNNLIAKRTTDRWQYFSGLFLDE